MPPQAEYPVVQVRAVFQGVEIGVCGGFVEGLHEATQHTIGGVAQQQDEPGLREYADYLTGVNDVEGEPVYQRDVAVRFCVARQRVKIGLSETSNVTVRKVCQGFQAFVRIS